MDAAKHLSDVGVVPHPVECRIARRRGRAAHESSRPAEEGGILGERWGLLPEPLAHELIRVLVVAPHRHESSQQVLVLLGCHPVGEIGRAADLCVDAQSQRPLWRGRREHARQLWPSGPPPQDGGSLHAGRIHDRSHVVHLDIQSGRPAQPVGHADAALVEVQDAQVLRQATHEAGEARLLPVDLQVRDPAVDDDQGDRTLGQGPGRRCRRRRPSGPSGSGGRPSCRAPVRSGSHRPALWMDGARDASPQ